MQEFGKKTSTVKAAIPHGGISEIALRCNASIYTVSRVINGKSRNKKVMEEIARYLQEMKSTVDSIEDLAQTLVI